MLDSVDTFIYHLSVIYLHSRPFRVEYNLLNKLINVFFPNPVINISGFFLYINGAFSRVNEERINSFMSKR